MLFTIQTHLASRDVEAWSLRAGVVRAFLAHDVHHTILSMLLAIHGRLDANKIEVREFIAGFTQATLLADIDHVALGMLLAVHPRLASCDIEVWMLQAGGMRTALVVHVHHAVHGMLLAINWRPTASFDLEGRSVITLLVEATSHSWHEVAGSDIRGIRTTKADPVWTLCTAVCRPGNRETSTERRIRVSR